MNRGSSHDHFKRAVEEYQKRRRVSAPSRDQDVTLRDRLQAARSYGLSIRALSQLTGLGFGTIQGIRSGRTQAPRETTIDRLNAGLDQLPTFRTERSATFADDRPRWSADDLAALEAPRGATSFRVVFWSEGTDTRTASSGWTSFDSTSPLDLVRQIGASPDVVRRVIWDK